MEADWESFTNRTLEVAEVRLLGMVDFPSVVALQKLMMHAVRQQSQVSACVLICEHPPVLSVGSQGNLLDLPTDQRELESRSLQVHKVARDGGTFLHQPGQLAVYAVVSLTESGLDEDTFRRRLSHAIIRTCRESQVAADCRSDDPGSVRGRHGLICEIGIGVDRGVTSFGAYLNVSCALDEARLFGRGSRGEKISSLNAERVRPSIMPQIRSSLIQHVCEQVGYPEYHIHTGHPFLKRTRHAVNLPESSSTEE